MATKRKTVVLLVRHGLTPTTGRVLPGRAPGLHLSDQGRAQSEGLVRTIGVSNFTEQHLLRLVDDTGVTPAVNQVEMHPYFPQADQRGVHERLGILTQAWSPMGKDPVPFEEEPVRSAAGAHDVTPGQVVLRWHLQLGSLPLPKAASPERQIIWRAAR